jgi:hypothetical protein
LVVNTKNTLLRPVHWFALFIFSCALAAQAQTVREEVSLLDKPDGKPGNVKLAAGSSVKAVKRQGFWVEVDASGKTGWLKVSQINFAGATGGATAIDTGRLGTGNIVATSAARGLSAKDLVSGQPDFNEVNKLDALTAPPQMVQSFLVAGGLVTVTEKIQLTAPRPAPTAPKAEGVSSSQNDPSTPKKKADDEW